MWREGSARESARKTATASALARTAAEVVPVRGPQAQAMHFHPPVRYAPRCSGEGRMPVHQLRADRQDLQVELNASGTLASAPGGGTTEIEDIPAAADKR